MNALWMDLSNAINPDHWIGFTIRGDGIFNRCVLCDATFPQSDDGWRTLKQHGFDAHEQPVRFDWRELHGKQVTIAVVERKGSVRYGGAASGMQVDLIARDDDGVVYFLPEAETEFTADYMRGGYKCKPKSAESNLLRLMQPVPASPSNG